MHHIATAQGMPQGLKIATRTGLTLFNFDWIAGVDFDEDEFDDVTYDEKDE